MYNLTSITFFIHHDPTKIISNWNSLINRAWWVKRTHSSWLNFLSSVFHPENWIRLSRRLQQIDNFVLKKNVRAKVKASRNLPRIIFSRINTRFILSPLFYSYINIFFSNRFILNLPIFSFTSSYLFFLGKFLCLLIICGLFFYM